MICKECKNKSIIRGIKQIKCFKCNIETTVNFVYSDICACCSDTYLICQCCGKEINNKEINEIKEISHYSHYHLNWLKIAIENFKNQNGISHMIDGSITMKEFIEKYARDELSKIVEV